MSTQAIMNIERLNTIYEAKRDTDYVFMDWWLGTLLMPSVTMGVYTGYRYYRYIDRRDKHFTRLKSFYTVLPETLKELATISGVDLKEDLDAYNRTLDAYETQKTFEVRGWGKSLLLNMVTCGVWPFFVLQQLLTDYVALEKIEQVLVSKTATMLKKLGVKDTTKIRFSPRCVERKFGLHLLLVFLTMGFSVLYLDYHFKNEPEAHFEETAKVHYHILGVLKELVLSSNGTTEPTETVVTL